MLKATTGSQLRGALGSAVLILTMAACSQENAGREERSVTRTADEESVEASTTEALCQAGDVHCIQVTPTRIAVLYASKDSRQDTESRDIVVWNPGGPGLTPPPPGVLDIAFPKALRGFDLLYFVEPWVVDPPSERCLNEGERDSSACPTDALVWSLAEMDEAVRTAEEEVGGSLVGLYGTSYGATANSALMPGVLANGGWAILENPAPPPGTSLSTIVTSRADAIVRLVAGWNGCKVEAPCYERRARLLRHWGEVGTDGLDPRRIALGLAALTTDPASNAAFLDQLTSRLDREEGPSASQQRALRRAADRFTLPGPRPGSVQPNMVGLRAGTCLSFGEADAELAGLAAGIATIYRGCQDQPPGDAPDRVTSSRVLLLHGRDDAVVPPELQRIWIAYAPNATSVELAKSGHFRDDGRVNAAISAWLNRLKNRP